MDIYDEINQKTELLLTKLRTPSSSITSSIYNTLTFPKDFQDFFSDYIFYKTPPTPTFSDNILTLSFKSGKSIQISSEGIFELLSDKYNQRLLEIPQQPLPNFEEVDRFIINKMFYISSSFDRYISFSDDFVRNMSHEYHKMMSYPLSLKIAYLEWERSLNYLKIEKVIKEKMQVNEELVEQTRKDYQSKFEKEKVDYRTKLELYKIEIERLRTIATHLKETTDSYKSKLDSLNEEVTKLRQKTSDSVSKSESLERTLSDTKIKLMRAESELKKYKSAEWTLSITSTLEKPIFIADTGDPETTKIITFPSIDDFKTNFKVASVEGDIIIYKAGNRTVEVPISLETQFPKLIEKLVQLPAKTKSITEPKIPKERPPRTPTSIKRLAKNPVRVRDALKDIHPEGMTMQEVADAAKVQYSNMSTYIFKLKNADQIEEKESITPEGRKITKYYYKP